MNYNEAGQPTSFSYGNGVSASMGYNDHLQIQSLSYSSGATTLLSLTYSYLDGSSHNNGQIQSITDSRGPVYTTSYTYDPLGRLSQASTTDRSSTSTWCLNWSYDRYGNRLSQSSCGGTLSVYQPQLQVNKSTNRISAAGYLYDANGNLTNDSVHTYAYDAENRLVSVDGGSHTYVYDGNGLRVKKDATVYVFAGTHVIAEYASGGTANSPQQEYLYSGGRMLATIASGTLTYHHPDHLSNRLETNSSGTVTSTLGHLPFGDSWYETGTAEIWKFTSYERDTESQADYAIARHFESRLARFLQPDPSDLAAATLSFPQTLNMYAYVVNSPVSLVDPIGLQCTQSSGLVLVYPPCPPAPNGPALPGTRAFPDGGARGVGANAAETDGMQIVNYIDNDAEKGGGGGDVSTPGIEGLFHAPGMASFWRTNYQIGAALFVGTGAVVGGIPAAVEGFPVATTLARGVGINLLARGVGWYYAFAGGSGVVLGEYQVAEGEANYLQAAKSIGANALNVPQTVYEFFQTNGEWWTLNRAFLNGSIVRGQQFFLSTAPMGAGGFLQEMQYLQDRGISVFDLPWAWVH